MAVLTPQQRIAALSPQQRQLFVNYVNGLKQPQSATPAGGSAFVLPGSAEAEFGAQRSNIGELYTEETARNQYDLRNAQIGHRRLVRDQADQYDQTRTMFPGQYINRGIMGSGIYRGNLGRLVQMRQRQMNDTSQDYTRQVAGLRLNREGIERRRALSLSNLRMKHQAVLGDAAGRIIK